MDDRSITETIKDSFLDLVDSAVEYTPRILAALLLLLAGLIVSRWLSKLIGRAIDTIETDKRVLSFAKRLNINVVNLSDIAALVTRWAILLIFVSAAVDALGVSVLTETFDELVDFVPNIFAAALIAGLAFIVGNVVKDVSDVAAKNAGIKAHNFISSSARVAVLVFGLPLAVAQLGLDLTVINNNLTVIVAGVMLAFALAFGLGGRDVAAKILEEQHRNWKK